MGPYTRVGTQKIRFIAGKIMDIRVVHFVAFINDMI
jgi:hypothetical protein